MSRRIWKTGLECGRGGASVCVWQESHGNEGQEQEGSSPAGRWRCSACGQGPGWFPGLSAVTPSDSGLGMPSLHLSEL